MYQNGRPVKTAPAVLVLSSPGPPHATFRRRRWQPRWLRARRTTARRLDLGDPLGVLMDLHTGLAVGRAVLVGAGVAGPRNPGPHRSDDRATIRDLLLHRALLAEAAAAAPDDIGATTIAEVLAHTKVTPQVGSWSAR